MGKSARPPAGVSAHPLMSLAEAAHYVGMPKATFWRRVKEQKVIGFLKERHTNRLRFRKEDLDQYLEESFVYHSPQVVETSDGRTTLSVRRSAGRKAHR